MEEYNLQAMNEFQSFNDMQKNKQMPFKFINVFVKYKNKWLYIHYDINEKKFSVYNCNSSLSLDQIQDLVEFLIQFLEDHYDCDPFPNDIYINSNDSKILNVTSSSINSNRTLNSELSYSQQINTNKEAEQNVQKLRQYKEAVAQGKIQEHKKTQSLALHRRQFPVDYDELVDLTDEKQIKKIRKQPFQYYLTKVPYDASPGNFQNRTNKDHGNFIKQNNSNFFSSMSQDSRLTKSQYISPRLKQPTQISNQSYVQPENSQFQQEHKQFERSVINQVKNLKNDPQKYKFFKKNVPELNYLVKQIKNMQQKYQLQDSLRSKNSQFNSQNYVQKLRDLRNLIDQQTDIYNKQNPVRFLQNQNQNEVVFQNKFIKNNPDKQIHLN
ncbi:hypothetical protein PPERSA_00891 [Pseudocohnilembus persalinus]|uniref:Uncharacterized protein n=1 Tax=Pseudocohnilembus persalinus TaxID=266149 RepID=A0A0V0QEU5_PSEPJ|nr:hypothetical protein PPERSA_00891 [Pseudocohnilembus persalinus]|eukprot:KRX00664.1 hypothetical protein PPERSA_00891 [Pseudocohnilembus persalinus]